MKRSAARDVDHIMVRVQEAEPLMNLFGSELGLPVSWPITRTDFATYGWITLGNANLEFWASRNNDDLPVDTALPLFHGFALEPVGLHNSITLLNGRGIACKEPRPYITKRSDGQEVTNFTNSVLLDVSSELNCVFFCEWGTEGTIFPWKGKLTTHERRTREQDQLTARRGGALGVTGLMEIQITTPDIVETEKKWFSITGQESPPVFLGERVKLHLTSGEASRFDSIVIAVASLEKARDVLADRGLLGDSSDDECSLNTAACSGLHFRFREPLPV
jgi:hypothetical protein